MKKNPPAPLPPESDLFRQAVAGVAPMPSSGRVVHAPPQKRPYRDSAPLPVPVVDALSDHGGEGEIITEFARSGISRMTLKNLRRKKWPVQDSLDLHGLNSDEARRLLQAFLSESVQNGFRCVSVIHGKGWHTGGVGVLKMRVRHWLTQCQEVLAFIEAPAGGGGGGAVWVLLKSG